MLTQFDNDTLTKVGPGTPMGDLMREYWLPAMLSTELPEPDCDPVRLRLLCEDMIAFRDTNGELGLIDNYCPHRRASLFFGRNEECGLRCVYHGWKFDVNGNCVDMPSEPAESNFKDKVKIKSYKLTERNGMIWAYMGPRETLPPLPDIEPNMMEESLNGNSAGLRNCNWVQAMEGDIDTAHLSFLHMGMVSAEDVPPGSFDFYSQRDRAPHYHVVETDYGMMYGAYRPAEEDTYYWRIAQFMMPFYTIPPEGRLGEKIGVRCWVPVDDDHTMFTSMSIRNSNNSMNRKTADGKAMVGLGGAQDRPENGTGFLERWRYEPTKENDYLIDRDAQKNQSFTGIVGIHIQDQAITESMGATSDRTRERLGTSDSMIIKTRQRLINAARALQEGVPAPAVDTPEVYQVRSGGVILDRKDDWLEATVELRKAFKVHSHLVDTAK
ncbi:MAG: Rieske 2Fe-2S domain-containing protein [SAR202 cluster bacterium]|nr:Rieske 2Fe-2S domain-containing protein [SAR202 cluster bacterium]